MQFLAGRCGWKKRKRFGFSAQQKAALCCKEPLHDRASP
jgi:hypothetical protein